MENFTVLDTKAANVTSVKEVNKIFEETRTDFRDESIYQIITTSFSDGDSGSLRNK